MKNNDMKDFYDLNTFLAFLLKKWKVIILIVLIVALGFAAYRGYDLLTQYRNQENTQASSEKVESSSEEPMWVTVGNIIKIAPNYHVVNGEIVDTSSEIAQAYYVCASDEEINDQLYDNYYEQEKEEDVTRKTLFNEYGYILDKEVKYPYERYDFLSQGSVKRETGTYTDSNYNYITVEYRSTNKQLAEKISKFYAEILTEKVTAIAGDYEYTYVGTTKTYGLPSKTEGAVPSRNISGSKSVGTVITKTAIIKQSIKGSVWGALIGVFASLICLFFAYMMTRKVVLQKDVKELGIGVYGVVYGKRRNWLARLKSSLALKLEGGKKIYTGMEEIARMISADMQMDKTVSADAVIVTSTCGIKYAQQLGAAMEEQFKVCECVIDSASGIDACKNFQYAILVEKFSVSYKDEIEKAINQYKKYGVTVLGVVCVE